MMNSGHGYGTEMDAAGMAWRAAGRKRLWLASTVLLAVTAAGGHALAQDAGATTLETVTVDGGKETGRGPDKGIVAKTSRSASKTAPRCVRRRRP